MLKRQWSRDILKVLGVIYLSAVEVSSVQPEPGAAKVYGVAAAAISSAMGSVFASDNKEPPDEGLKLNFCC